jgi:AcrR family transcriptional regulator
MQKPGAAPRSRPRDAQATRELLLAAATEEFSEFGLAGARIDRIAERAGCNKRLIYVYFGDKDRLFDTALKRQIEILDQEVPFTPDDLAAFAAARFDYVVAHPQTSRLAAWRTFERAEPTEAEVRSYKIKVEAIEGAQKSGKLNTDIAAVDLFAMVLRLTESWLSAPPALRSLAAEDPDANQRIRQHRAALVDAVCSFTTPTNSGARPSRTQTN